MNNIQLNIVANAQFQQVYAEVAKLKEAMLSLQKASVGGPFTPQVTASIKQAQNAFDNAVLSTRAFNIESVAMTSNVEKFGKQLAAGNLSLSNYYKIWRDSAKGTSQELDNLAASQARLNRSIAIADPLRPGYAKLVTDINGVVTAEEKAIFYQQSLNTALQQGSIKLIDFGKNTQWMGRQLTVGLTMPLAIFGASASQAYLSFDKQMTDMLKVYGSHAVVQSQQTLDQIQKQVTDLADKVARTLGVAMTDTVEIAKTFSSIGLEGDNLIKTTEATVKLQKLGGLQATEAAQSMVALQNVFKLQSSQMSDAVNFLNAAKHSTSTTMQDIIDAIPRVGPILQQMGGTYKDFVTLLVGMRESGVPAAQAANAIKSMFASIENPTARATKLFDSLGISLKGIVANDANNPLKMVQDLQEGLDKLPSTARSQAIEQLFGKFQFARVEALLNNLGKTGSQTQKVLELYGKSSTDIAAVAQQELDISSNKTPAAQFQKMKATLQADLIPLGRAFLESFTKLGNALDKVFGYIKGIANALGPVAKVLGLLGGTGLAGLIVAGPLIMLAGLFANLIGNILRGANAMRMFKQGMESASSSENKFLAGLHGMRNFYQDLDKSVIASRNQLDLMPDAITTSAKAFDILNESIATLTAQFVALAEAQRAAMGFGAAGGTGVFKIPFSGMATGGWVPGNPAHGDVYPAMLTGKEAVVPYPNSVKHASIINAIMNDNLPGYQDGLEQNANGLTKKGIKIVSTTKHEYKPFAGAYGIDIPGKTRIKINKDLERDTADPLEYKESLMGYAQKQVGIGPVEESKQITTHLSKYLEALKGKANLAGEELITEENSKKILSEFNNEYLTYLDELKASGKKLGDTSNQMAQIADRVMRRNAALSADPQQFLSSWEDVNKTYSSSGKPTNRGSGAGGGSRKISVNLGEFGTTQVDKLKGGSDNLFYHSDNPAFTTSSLEQTSAYQNKISKLVTAQAESQGKMDAEAYQKGFKEQTRKNAKTDPYEINRSTQRSSHPKVAKDAKDDAQKYNDVVTQTLEKETQPSKIDRFASKYSIAGRLAQQEGRLGKLGEMLGNMGGAKFGMASMLAPMAMNMIPNKIGGTDVSGIKGIASSVSSVVGMASFIPGAQAFLPEIAIGATLFGGIKWAFGQADKKRKEFEQGVRDTYAKLATTPDKFIDKLNTQLQASDANANSYKNMSIYGKVYGDSLLTIAQNIGNGSLKGAQMNAVLDTMLHKTKDTTGGFNELYNAAKNAGNANMTKLLDQLQLLYGKGTQAVGIFMQLQSLAASGVDISGVNGADQKSINAAYDTAISNAKKQIENLKQQNKVSNASSSASGKSALDIRLKKEEATLKILEAQLKTMQDQAKTAQQQNDYATKQADLDQQIAQAKITGNYLQANILKQQKAQETGAYNQQQAIDVQTAAVDAQRNVVDSLNQQKADQAAAAAATAAQTAATANNTAAINDLTAQIAQWEKDKLGTQSLKPGTTETQFLAEHGGSKNSISVTQQYGASGSGGLAVYTASFANLKANGVSIQVGNTFKDSTGKTYKIQGVFGQDVTVAPLGRASGGLILGAGTSTSDSILTKLSNGEYVMSAAAVNQYGLSMMNAINSKKYSVSGNNYGITGRLNSGNNGEITYNVYTTVNVDNADARAIADMASKETMRQLKVMQDRNNKTNKAVRI